MNSSCPDPREMTRFVDGDLAAVRAALVRDHLAGCSRCAREHQAQGALIRRIAAPLDGPVGQGALERLRARLGADETVRRGPRARWLPAIGAAVAAAVAVAFLVLPHRGGDRGEFVPRGHPGEGGTRVGLDLWALEGAPRKLSAGSRIDPRVPLVVSYGNADPAPAYLLAFAIDREGELHWLYPGYLDARSDPESVRLEGSVAQRALAEAVLLEDVPPGPLRFVFVLSREPLRVSSIETLSRSDRGPDALRGRFPAAHVEELTSHVEPGTAPPEVAP